MLCQTCYLYNIWIFIFLRISKMLQKKNKQIFKDIDKCYSWIENNKNEEVKNGEFIFSI